jgi:hypothetical protein
MKGRFFGFILLTEVEFMFANVRVLLVTESELTAAL